MEGSNAMFDDMFESQEIDPELVNRISTQSKKSSKSKGRERSMTEAQKSVTQRVTVPAEIRPAEAIA